MCLAGSQRACLQIETATLPTRRWRLRRESLPRVAGYVPRPGCTNVASVAASTRNCAAACFGSPIDSAMCGALLRLLQSRLQCVHALERVRQQRIEKRIHSGSAREGFFVELLVESLADGSRDDFDRDRDP